ncbi:Zn-dependent exopeptidase [Sistotremastrum suecicum HHB10207 ss-3]|uniref:Peptide hydrolase n=1 Tax=Sistotremastrum suecicum HHB10207 ss-3 TaxID=1314776 RepID=A0A166ECM2_9AGAM|nr:Zn-dependent exopeptidase [Sistotremastrum suecicum HHB10207 ss-3]
MYQMLLFAGPSGYLFRPCLGDNARRAAHQTPELLQELNVPEGQTLHVLTPEATEQIPLPYPEAIPQQPSERYSVRDIIRRVINTLSEDNLRENLDGLTSFDNRYYDSVSGRESQRWLFERISNITTKSVSHTTSSYVSVQEFEHPWLQNSIIAQIKGKTDELVIIGAHLDSLSISDPEGPAPGADDDGSGVVSALEAYRAIISSGIEPNLSIEFHWYAAEEVGWLGSQDVVKAYTQRGARVRGMLQFDMTAWVKNGTREEIGILDNCADEGLRNLTTEFVAKYLAIPSVSTKYPLDYCSDDRAWWEAGYPTIGVLEGTFENANRLNIHTQNDRSDISPEFSFSHMLEFSKLAVAFAMELGGVAG